MVQMHVQQRRTGGGHRAAQRRLDMIDVVEPFGVVEIDDEMHAGAAHPVSHHEMIVACFGFGQRRRDDRGIFLSGGTWGPQVHPQLEEGVRTHAVLPNQRSNPRRRRAGSTESETPLEQTQTWTLPSGSGPHNTTLPACKRFFSKKVPIFVMPTAKQAMRYRRRDQTSAAAACWPGAAPVHACASTTAIAVILTMPRGVTEGVRMWAGRAAPMRIGPTGSASANAWMAW